MFETFLATRDRGCLGRRLSSSSGLDAGRWNSAGRGAGRGSHGGGSEDGNNREDLGVLHFDVWSGFEEGLKV